MKRVLRALKRLNDHFFDERYRIELYDNESCNLYDFESGVESASFDNLIELEKHIEELINKIEKQ